MSWVCSGCHALVQDGTIHGCMSVAPYAQSKSVVAPASSEVIPDTQSEVVADAASASYTASPDAVPPVADGQ